MFIHFLAAILTAYYNLNTQIIPRESFIKNILIQIHVTK